MEAPPRSPPPDKADVQGSAPKPTFHPAIDRQLARLFGESLFGAWLDPVASMASGHRQRKRGHLAKRLGIVLLVGALVSTGVWVTRRGFARRVDHDRAHVASDVRAFLAEGELDRLAQFLSLLSPPGQPVPPTDPYLDLIVESEAVLYRYQDAAPARLARIQSYLSVDDGAHAKRLLARLTVASRTERAASLDTLESMLPVFAKDPQYRTLMATVQEERHDVAAARQSWDRSFQAGPLWLPHRYQQCDFEARQRNREAVARITQHMARVAPDSAWTRLAIQHFPRPSALPADSGTSKPFSPVAQYHAQLILALESIAAGDLRSARQALGRAFTAVHDQAPFVLDAFDRLVEANARNLAIEITSFEAWPRGHRWAQAKLDDLQAKTVAPEGASAAEPAKLHGGHPRR